MNLRFSRLLLLVPLFSSSVFGLPGPTSINNHVHNSEKRGLLFDILDLLQDVLSLDPLGDIIKGIDSDARIPANFPGLRGILAGAKSQAITPESYCRGLLLAIQQHDVYKQEYGELDPDLKDKVQRFLAGENPAAIVRKRSDFYIPPSPAAKHHFKRMEEVGRTPASRAWLNAKRQTSPAIYEDADGKKVMKV